MSVIKDKLNEAKAKEHETLIASFVAQAKSLDALLTSKKERIATLEKESAVLQAIFDKIIALEETEVTRTLLNEFIKEIQAANYQTVNGYAAVPRFPNGVRNAEAASAVSAWVGAASGGTIGGHLKSDTF